MQNLSTSKSKCRRKRPDIDKQWFIDNWINTSKSLKQLSVEQNVSLALLDNRSRSYGLKKPIKHPCNTSKLFNLSDPNIWYIAGLIATDGYIVKKWNAFELALTGDSEHRLLQSIAEYLETTANITQYGKSWRLRIVAKGLPDFLFSTFNIPAENKTFNVGIPSSFPSESCAKAYIKGCVDGDGSISPSRYYMRLTTASEKFVLGFNDIIEKYVGIKMSFYYERRNNKRYPTSWASLNRAKKLLDWIYSEETLCLERKYLNYCKVKDIV